MQRIWKEYISNLFLITPFLVAFGAALYFTMPFEPNIPAYMFIAAIIVGILLFRKATVPARGALLFLFGFCYAATYTNIIDTARITRNINGATIIGTVTTIDYAADKTRIYMTVASDQINATGRETAVIRMSLGEDVQTPQIGDRIRAHGGIFRPGAADAPGGFDYARWTYFNGITATGYITEYETVTPAKSSGVNSLRDTLHRHANSFLTDGLVLGYKSALPDDHHTTWVICGIGHVWSISGFHMTLVAGWLFALFYFIFRRIPYITRRVPARAVAMCVAWIGLGTYLFLSGAAVATIRAFLMTSLIFAAFIFGRNAISMRNICIAFCVIFLINPHSVMQAGFQLSFAAIFGLIWFWGDVKPKLPENKILKIAYVAVLTSVIATIFTTPFVAAHFYSVPAYGLLGNLILLPIFSVAIMPLVMIGTITAAFGLHAPLRLAHTIYDYTLNIADGIANMPAAAITTPYITNTALAIIIIGFVALMVVKSGRMKINYIIFGTCILTGAIINAAVPRPIFFATADHELVAFANNNEIEFNKSRASNHFFTFDTWKNMRGISTDTPNKRRAHDHGLYLFETPKFTVAYIQKFVPLMNNIERLCRDDNIEYIVSYFNIRSQQCDHKILRDGFVIYPSGSVRHITTRRRWHNPRG